MRGNLEDPWVKKKFYNSLEMSLRNIPCLGDIVIPNTVSRGTCNTFTVVTATLVSYIHTTHLSVRSSDKAEPLEHLNESQLCLKQSKPHPNASPRTISKWHIGLWRTLGFLLSCEPKEPKL